MKILCSLLIALFCILPQCKSSTAEQDRDILFQTSTINALLEGVFEGNVTYKELKQHGDFGLGTFNNLNGEMIALNNNFYQIKADGKVYPVADSQITPFAVVTFFDQDSSISVKGNLNYDELKQHIDKHLPTENIFYAIKIEGSFQYVKARSVPQQKKPYPEIMEIIKVQPIFEFEEIKGTMVGFRLPTYMNGINVPGYHLHFITEDKTAGGHVLDCKLKDVTIEIDFTTRSYLNLPEVKDFYSANLTKKEKVDINKVEK